MRDCHVESWREQILVVSALVGPGVFGTMWIRLGLSMTWSFERGPQPEGALWMNSDQNLNDTYINSTWSTERTYHWPEIEYYHSRNRNLPLGSVESFRIGFIFFLG